MDGKRLVAVLLVGGIVLYYLSKGKGVEASVMAGNKKQIDDAAAKGMPILIGDTGERIGWVVDTPQGPVPVIPWASTPEQELEAIRVFDQSINATPPFVPIAPPVYVAPPAYVPPAYEPPVTYPNYDPPGWIPYPGNGSQAG